MAILGIIGEYRRKLVEYMHEEKYPTTPAEFKALNDILDDRYISLAPVEVDLLITYYEFDSKVVQIVGHILTRFPLRDGDTDSYFYAYDVLIYGEEYPYNNRPVIYKRYMDCSRIIEYKLLDNTDAPLLINWHWLDDSLKKKLFGV